jgi:hypothetical protein
MLLYHFNEACRKPHSMTHYDAPSVHVKGRARKMGVIE